MDRAPERTDLYDLLEAADGHFRRCLKAAPAAVDYLKGRGLTGIIARDFGIGYAPDEWHGLAQALAGGKSGAREKDLRVIEDCCHATGAALGGVKVGNHGDVAFFSSERSKVFSTVLGGANFVDSLATHRTYDEEIPQRRTLETALAIDEVLEAVACAFDVPIDAVLKGGRRNDARSVAVALCRRPGGQGLRSIAEQFGLGHYSAVTINCRRLSDRMQRDRVLAARHESALKRLLAKLSSVKT